MMAKALQSSSLTISDVRESLGIAPCGHEMLLDDVENVPLEQRVKIIMGP